MTFYLHKGYSTTVPEERGRGREGGGGRENFEIILNLIIIYLIKIVRKQNLQLKEYQELQKLLMQKSQFRLEVDQCRSPYFLL